MSAFGRVTPPRPKGAGPPLERLALLLLAGALVAALWLWLAPAPAQAQTLSPWWSITTGSRPTQLAPGGKGQLIVTATNLGDAPTAGKITIEDQLPKGLSAIGVEGIAGGPSDFELGKVLGCEPTAKTVRCEVEKFEKEFEKGAELLPAVLPPYEQIELKIAVTVAKGAKSGELNSASVSGGGAAVPVSASHKIEVGGPLRFGIEEYSLIPEEEGGATDTQAGSHPFQVTSVVTLDSQGPDSQGHPRTVALPKNVIAQLPPGLIGNPTPFAQCTDVQFAKGEEPEERGKLTNACPAESAIGVASLTFNEPSTVGFGTIAAPIFNMVPHPGEPARFGIRAAGLVSAFLDTSLRSGSDYGVTVSSLNIPEVQWLLGAKLTFWGTPGAPAHDHQRGWDCLYDLGGPSACPTTGTASAPPFLIMPSSCAARPLESTLQAESWSAPGKPTEVATPFTYTLPAALGGCDQLPFSPSITVIPEKSAASTPTGMAIDVHIPQDTLLDAHSLSQSTVKEIAVTLPSGVVVNPSDADGLEACSEGLVGFTGRAPTALGSETPTFTPKLPEALQPGVNFCPTASKLGTAKITTPLLPKGQDLNGFVYLATQNANPFGSLIALYVVAEDPVSGSLVKLTGETQLSPSGQITTTFKDSPQVAFEDAELHFFGEGDERAPLATPGHCGPYTTDASFTPWSGNPPASSQSTFLITSGPNGGPCPGQSLPFSPTLAAGMLGLQAGQFGTLTTTVNRQDGEQDLGAVSVKMPPGVSGVLTGVKLCPEAQANAGTCPAESKIGETTVSAGVGSEPVTVKGGAVYITEGYKGAPFGLSITNPVKAGPFDLERDSANPSNNPACDCLVVRAKVEVDPLTAQLQVSTDSEGPYAIPRIVDGVPVQIKHVNVLITRSGFTFNPTNCSPLSLSATVTGGEGASHSLAEPFQVAHCQALGFHPDFKASTAGKTSKASGASLQVKLSYPKAPFGTQANIASVKVDLPRALPSRLTTLQKACLSKVFEANPQTCPADSIVGHAKVVTQVLPVPLEGNAYFVSHGNEAFPNLTIVLKGYGVTIDLVGSTFIKNGVTSNTFKSNPDVPFETFELSLPQGPNSALAANGNLCSQNKTTITKRRVRVRRNGHVRHILRTFRHTSAAPLLMPTAFVAQNGAQLHQNTTISVSGCAKAKKKTKHKRKRKGSTGRRRRK
jgi:uncharacterized repeat protein (TIGR01451 family)